MLCRWIKFEEDVEEGGERWSKPHVATLQLHVLQELREMLRSDQSLLLLNLEDVNAIEQIAGASRHADSCHATPTPRVQLALYSRLILYSLCYLFPRAAQ